MNKNIGVDPTTRAQYLIVLFGLLIVIVCAIYLWKAQTKSSQVQQNIVAESTIEQNNSDNDTYK